MHSKSNVTAFRHRHEHFERTGRISPFLDMKFPSEDDNVLGNGFGLSITPSLIFPMLS